MLIAADVRTVHGPVLINDTGIRLLFPELSTQNGGFAELLESQALAEDLDTVIKRRFTPEILQSTVLLLPGEGAVAAESYSFLSKNCSRSLHIKAHRHWQPGSSPIIEMEKLEINKSLENIKDVIVLDDVISSGRTMNTVYDLNKDIFPGAQWHAAVWLSQRNPDCTNFANIFAGAKIIHEGLARVPINSLSTLIKDPQRAAFFAKRNFKDPDTFLNLLKQIKNINY